MRTPTTWITDWSDREHRDFHEAWRAEGLSPRVLRGPALGSSVGTRGHRLRSWPAYLGLAVRGLRHAEGALVAWQPAAGMLAAQLRRGPRPPLTVLNPILDHEARGAKGAFGLGGLRRSDRVVVYSSRELDRLSRAGLDRSRLRFVPLGIRTADVVTPTPGHYLLAAGRSHRDWATLSAAARGLPLDVVVLGPDSLRSLDGCRVVAEKGKDVFARLLADAAALVVPLKDGARQAGTLAVLDAMSRGRAVVATRGPGTEDYVLPESGALVDAGDAVGLHRALRAACDVALARAQGAAGVALARERFSLNRFVRDIEREALAAPGVLRQKPEG